MMKGKKYRCAKCRHVQRNKKPREHCKACGYKVMNKVHIGTPLRKMTEATTP